MAGIKRVADSDLIRRMKKRRHESHYRDQTMVQSALDIEFPTHLKQQMDLIFSAMLCPNTMPRKNYKLIASNKLHASDGSHIQKPFMKAVILAGGLG